MKYRIDIDCDNAAFEEDPAFEVATILERLANRLERFGLEDEAPLIDTNGNQVGKAVLYERTFETYREIPTLDQEDV